MEGGYGASAFRYEDGRRNALLITDALEFADDSGSILAERIIDVSLHCRISSLVAHAEAATDVTGRSLFAVGARDGQRFRDTTRAMYENAPEPKRFETLDSAEHAQGIFGTPAGDRLHDLVVSFVDAVCEGS